MKILVIIIVALLGLISIVTLLLVPSQQISMQQNIPDINKSVVGAADKFNFVFAEGI